MNNELKLNPMNTLKPQVGDIRVYFKNGKDEYSKTCYFDVYGALVDRRHPSRDIYNCELKHAIGWEELSNR